MTPETRITQEQPKTLRGIFNALKGCVDLVVRELKYRKDERLELRGIIIDDRNTKYEDEVCDDLAKKLSEKGSNPYNLGKWFSNKCVPQFYDLKTQFPFNYISEKDPRNKYNKNEYNLLILRYRVWKKLYDRVLTLHRADIIDIRGRFFDVLLDSQ